MDKIYSRKRIKIFYSDKKTIKKKMTFTIIIIIATITIIYNVKSIDPIFESLCKEKAIQISTDITNTEATKVVHKYDYKDLISINKNETDNTSILKTDVRALNDIASDIGVEINKRLIALEQEQITIPAGAILGNKYLAGFGPGINMSIIPIGSVMTEVKTEFEAQGINQTVYRIYLEVVCDVDIVTSYKTIETQIVNQVLLVETVIVGEVPETYYNLEGMTEESSMQLID